MNTQIEERKKQYNAAVADLNRAADAIEKAPADADFGSLREELDAATTEAERCRANLDAAEESAKRRANFQAVPGGPQTGLYRGSGLRSDQLMRDYLISRGKVEVGDDKLSLGKYLRGMALGRWEGAEAEKRALAEGTIAAGGAMVPTFLAAQLIDVARAQAVVLKAGALTVPLDTKQTKYARLTGDASGEWHTENATLTDEDLTFDNVTFEAKTATVLVKAPLELVEDAVNLEDVVAQTFGKVLALKMDYGALAGDGTGASPTGVKNTALVGAGTYPTTWSNYDVVVDAIGDIRAANWEPNALITHPDTLTAWAKLKDTLDNPLTVPADVAALGKFPTTQLGTSDLIVGAWNQLLWGVRTEVHFEIFRETLIEKLQFAFLAYVRCDFRLAHPAAFVVFEESS